MSHRGPVELACSRDPRQPSPNAAALPGRAPAAKAPGFDRAPGSRWPNKAGSASSCGKPWRPGLGLPRWPSCRGARGCWRPSLIGCAVLAAKLIEAAPRAAQINAAAEDRVGRSHCRRCADGRLARLSLMASPSRRRQGRHYCSTGRAARRSGTGADGYIVAARNDAGRVALYHVAAGAAGLTRRMSACRRHPAQRRWPMSLSALRPDFVGRCARPRCGGPWTPPASSLRRLCSAS